MKREEGRRKTSERGQKREEGKISLQPRALRLYKGMMNASALVKVLRRSRATVLVWCSFVSLAALAAPAYEVYVTDEHSGEITVIDGATHKVTSTFPVGKRPRG